MSKRRSAYTAGLASAALALAAPAGGLARAPARAAGGGVAHVAGASPCARIGHRAHKAPPATRGRLMRAYRRCVRRARRQRHANLAVQALIANSRLVGARGDGETVDDTYCADGQWRDRSSMPGEEVGIAEGKHWWITGARFKGADFTALLRGDGGYEIALARHGGQYEYGIAAFGKGSEYGKVTKTDATAACGAGLSG